MYFTNIPNYIFEVTKIHKIFAHSFLLINSFFSTCLKDGKVCIADSQEKIPYAQFVKQLEKYGVQEALYMDMGPGWNHSWYRDNHNHVHELFPHTHNFTTNWIVFKKM